MTEPTTDEPTSDTPTSDTVIEELQRTLDFAMLTSHVVLNILADISKNLINPLILIDPDELTDVGRDMVLRKLKPSAVRLADQIEFALVAHAGIEEGTEATSPGGTPVEPTEDKGS